MWSLRHKLWTRAMIASALLFMVFAVSGSASTFITQFHTHGNVLIVRPLSSNEISDEAAQETQRGWPASLTGNVYQLLPGSLESQWTVAAQPAALKIEVRRNGWYRIGQARQLERHAISFYSHRCLWPVPILQCGNYRLLHC